jgi:DNA-binding NarL/FixJ family response regulator
MKILVADDHPLYREAVAIQISRIFADTQIVEVASVDELYAALRESAAPFDLFLIDYKMPGMSVAAVSELVSKVPSTPIAIISGSAQPIEIKAAIEAGARGYVPKTATGERLAHALKLILAGGTSVPAELLFEGNPADENSGWFALLSQREMEVLRGVGRGLSNKEIGRELNLAEVTIKLHLRSLFRKMGARSRADAAVMASKAGLV